MRKFLAVSAFVALLAGSAFAENFFVGGEGGWFYSHGDDEIDDDDTNFADFGLKLGYIITDNHRIYGAYRYDFGGRFIDFKRQAHKFLFGYDFTPQLYDAWRGVLGVFGGYTYLRGEYDDGSSVSFKKGFAYGAKVGALYEFDANNEMEFGLRVEQVGADADLSFTDFGLYAGYAYKF